MMVTSYQTAQRTQEVAKHARPANRAGIELEGAFPTMDANRCADEFPFIDKIVSFQSRITDEKKRLFYFISSDQSMKNQSSVDAVKKNGTATDVARLNRANANGFAIEKGGGHTLPSRFKMNGRILRQQREDNLIGFRMERAGHEEKF